MQVFDIATVLLTFVLFGFLFAIGATRGWLKTLSFALGACLLVHLFVEGFRWQMIPAYLVAITTLICVALRLNRFRFRKEGSFLGRVGRWLGATIAIFLLSLTALLSFAFPIFDIPEPSGEYAVGTMEMHLIDDGRAEIYTDDALDKRELMVRVWYPAESSVGNDRVKYWQHPLARSRAVTRSTPLPWFAFTHLGLVKTHSYWGAPVAKREPTYPVILYSHGSGIGWASANTKLVEGLASHGYIVMGIDHAFVGSLSIYPDGRLVSFDDATARAMNQPPPKEVRDLQSRIGTVKDWREQIALYEQGMTLMSGTLAKVDQALNTQVADHLFLISRLEYLQSVGEIPLTRHLDLQRVGLVGMSLGGSAVLETCSLDRRCKAGVNLDGFHPRHIDLALQETPFLFLNRSGNLLYNTNFQSARSPVYSVLITGVTHFNFFDFSIMSPLYKRLGVLGPIDGNRILDLTEDYVRVFFDNHLRDQSDPDLVSLSGKYPEVKFTQRNEGAAN